MVAVVHRTVFASCCQPSCLTLCAVVRLSHLEDTFRPVDAVYLTACYFVLSIPVFRMAYRLPTYPVDPGISGSGFGPLSR